MIAAPDAVSPDVAHLLEIHMLKINTGAILSTSMGRCTGAQILAGQTQRGDVDPKGFPEMAPIYRL